MFILFANVLGLLPLGVVGIHPFTFTSHFTATGAVSYTHLRAHETVLDLVCRLLLEKKHNTL